MAGWNEAEERHPGSAPCDLDVPEMDCSRSEQPPVNRFLSFPALAGSAPGPRRKCFRQGPETNPTEVGSEKSGQYGWVNRDFSPLLVVPMEDFDSIYFVNHRLKKENTDRLPHNPPTFNSIPDTCF